MGNQITVQPAQLDAARQKVEAALPQYQNAHKQLYSEVNAMGQAWQGADNVAYVKQINQFEDDFQRLEKLMQQYIEFLHYASSHYGQTQGNVASGAGKLRTGI
jgi:WXG100 family type VII secretion target